MATEDDFTSFHAAVFARLVGQVTLVTGDRHEAEDAPEGIRQVELPGGAETMPDGHCS